MIARVIAKTAVQAMLTALRAAGLTVTKSESGFYRAVTFTGHPVFEAAPGSKGYLVRMEADLFTEVARGRNDYTEAK